MTSQTFKSYAAVCPQYRVWLMTPWLLLILTRFCWSQTELPKTSKGHAGPKNENSSNLTIAPIDAAAPSKTDTATFAMGCFWCPDYTFGSLAGVVRTRVGYAGGTTENPTYSDLGDHMETIQIDFDPRKTSFEGLLDVFWENHESHLPAYRRQYTCAVFYQDERQKELALRSKKRIAEKGEGEIFTQILPAGTFHLAESYHQKYELRQHEDLMEQFNAVYPNEMDFINSTAAARVNSFVSGHGDIELLEAEIHLYGLSHAARQKLLKIARKLRH